MGRVRMHSIGTGSSRGQRRRLQGRGGANATSRLIAWGVADAFGARAKLDPTVALKIGKRLAAQAQRVIELLVGVAADAVAQREIALSPPADETPPEEEVAARITAIDTEEKERVEKLRAEVYTNLQELGALVPYSDDSDDDACAVAELSLHEPLASTSARISGEPTPPHWPPPSIPVELAERLGHAGTQELWAWAEKQESFVARPSEWFTWRPHPRATALITTALTTLSISPTTTTPPHHH